MKTVKRLPGGERRKFTKRKMEQTTERHWMKPRDICLLSCLRTMKYMRNNRRDQEKRSLPVTETFGKKGKKVSHKERVVHLNITHSGGSKGENSPVPATGSGAKDRKAGNRKGGDSDRGKGTCTSFRCHGQLGIAKGESGRRCTHGTTFDCIII